MSPLPHDVEAWLRGLVTAQQEDGEDYPPTVRKRLLYVLSRALHSGGPTVSFQSVEVQRDGTLGGAVTRHEFSQLLRTGQQPKFLRPSDRTILPQLSGIGIEIGATFIPTLRAMIAIGRSRWVAWDGPALVEGEAVSGNVEWHLNDDGSQKPDLVLPAGLLVLRMAVPWYVQPETGRMGPIETPLSPRLLRAMLSSPAVPPALVDQVQAELSRRCSGRNLPAPKLLSSLRPLEEPMQPHLLLLVGELRFDPAAPAASGRYHPSLLAEPDPVPLVRPSWRYGPVSIPAHTRFQPNQVVQRNGTLFELKRDRVAEERAAATLNQLGFEQLGRSLPLPNVHPHANDLTLSDPEPAAWLDFVLFDVAHLRDEGWLVDVDNSFPIRLAQPSGDIDFIVAESSGIDWFDLDLGVMVDGQRISLGPALLEVIGRVGLSPSVGDDGVADEQELPLLVPLPDGRTLALPLARLQPVLALLLELFDGAGIDGQAGTFRLSRHEIGDLALLEEASAANGIAWSGGEAVRALGRQLRDGGGLPPCPVPEGFGTTLRPYQQQGLAWLQLLRAAGLGGVLADDMGLGKTVQTLAHLVVEQAGGRADLPSLVVCPTSLVPNWQAEARRFAPALRCLVLYGSDRATRFGEIGAHDLVITTYTLLAYDQAVLTAQDWHIVVLDEAQTIKNPQTAVSKLVRTLRARQRLCLSGTPLENHLGELWSLFDFLMPGFLGNRQQFGRRFRGPIEKNGDTERQTFLARRVAPFLLRRTKDQVAPELPTRTEITETVEMGQAQQAIYEGIRLAMHAKARAALAKRGLAGSGIVILDALLKLRQTCCDPRLVKVPAAKAAKARSAKLDRLLELLPPLLEERRRVLLFSQFTEMLALIETELARLSLPYVLLTGDTKDRTGPVRRFQSGEVPLFLISLKAGGVGLNLTAADTVIHFDPWWNPAVEDQATSRAHRIGQNKPVFVRKLITAGTVEEKVEGLKSRKQALVDGILGKGGGTMLTLTEDDIDLLFGR